MRLLLSVSALIFWSTFAQAAEDLKCSYQSKSQGMSSRKKFTITHGEYLEFPISEKRSRIVSYATDEDAPEGFREQVSIIDVDRRHVKAVAQNGFKRSKGGFYRWQLGTVTEKGALIYSYVELADGSLEEISLFCTF